MNARQHRKVQKIQDGLWAGRLWRCRAWHPTRGIWVKLWPDHPEVVWLIRQAGSCALVQAAVTQGSVHAKKQREAVRI